MRMQIQYKIHNGQKGRIEINNGREEVNLYCYHIGYKIESNRTTRGRRTQALRTKRDGNRNGDFKIQICIAQKQKYKYG